MIHGLRVSCLVLVLAMSASVASVASAAEYHSAGAPTTITGSQSSTNAFHVPGAGTVECTTATFHSAQATTTTKELTVHPTYGGCKAFGFANTHINTAPCNYTFTEPSGGKAAVHVACSGGSISITPTFLGSSVCTMTVGSQTTGGNVDLANQAGGKVLVTSTVTNIAHSAGCGASAAADGTYTGSVLTQGSAGAISVS